MRVFLCDFGVFSMAVPMHSVSSLTSLADMAAQNDVVVHNKENKITYVSLPLLFRLPLEDLKHGIVLRGFDNKDDDTAENKIILISTKIVREIEIPDGEIYPVQDTLNSSRFSMLFSGIHLSERPAHPNPVLLLNPEQLVQYVREMAA